MPPRVGLRGIDPWITLAFLALICIGVLMVYSSSIADAYTYYGSATYVLDRELIWVALGLAALAAAATFDYRHWQRGALLLFGISFLLLVLVLVPHLGHSSHGARRWFQVGSSLTLQPSELIKLALVVYMAAWLGSKGERVADFKACFVPFSIMVGAIFLLVDKEPDLGTALVIAVTMLAVFFVAGGDLAHLVLAILGASGVAWMLMHSSSYRYDRLTAFINPWKDPTGTGYHTIQALLALGSGGWLGAGLGNSVQKYYLPAPHTDSILAVIGEEWGLLGTLTILLLFLVIAYRGIRIASTAPDTFGRLLAAGITSWVTFQALMNYAVITSSVPFTGVPLPFISYGGSSLVITTTAIGILLNISRHTSGEGIAQDSDHRRGNRRASVPRAVGHPVPERSSRPQRRARPAGGAAALRGGSLDLPG